MQIYVEELAHNPDRYLEMLNKGNAYIVPNGEQIAKLIQTAPAKAGIASKLFGILSKGTDLDRAGEERLSGF